MTRHSTSLRLVIALGLILATPARAVPDGAALYKQHCGICHGAEGAGIEGIFPPLAMADFLTRERKRALKAPLEGLQGEIVVNGRTYQGAMPPAFLDDEELAAVFNHIFQSWGNDLPPVTVEEVTALRADTRFPTLEALKASMVGGELPVAPAGWKIAVGAELSFSPTRLAVHPDGKRVLALTAAGDVWEWNPETGETARIFSGKSYTDPSLGDVQTMGITVDSAKRLYITSNQRNTSTQPVMNEMIIFRTEPWTEEKPRSTPTQWFRNSSPFGIGPYNHGLSHIAQGPDGMLYLNCGSRTDGGEAGNQANYSTAGEEPDTAVIWRMDPEAEEPTIEIFASGLRNTYGFTWDGQGRMVGTENGPDAHAPEELNFIRQGRHYGFPYQFSNWSEKAYPHTPDAPAGIEFTPPLRNLGPDGGRGLSTFDAHSSPAGIVWLGKDWPAPLGGSFLTVRFGNLLKLDQDVGFDLLQIHADLEAGTLQTTRLMAPLGRPIDLVKLSGRRLVIAEYSRETNFAAGMGTPGRLLVLQPE
jgi:glucose/arabinose dehydrogenase/cytochrome c553